LAQLRWYLASSLLLLFSACAQLPQNVDRPVSSALASPDGTPLAALVQQRRQTAAARFDSGFLLLAGPPAAYGSRLALVEAAQKTLDLQYYAIHADASTARLLSAVRDAARRGVRVRILLDDFHSTGRNALVMRLAFVPNIEMRMFNPLAGARGSSLGRVLASFDDASRIQQRMHNKLFIADNAMAVTGGRNLGDAYFGNAKDSNFIDVDVLAAGPIVQDLSRSFDSYWNNERAYPVQSLVSKKELDDLRERVRTEDTSSREPQGTDGAKPPDGEPRPPGDGPTPEQRAQAWDQKPMDLGQAAFVWAPAVVLADKPGKIAPDESSPDAAAGKAPGLIVTRQYGRPSDTRASNALDNAADAASSGDTVVEGLLQLIGQAKRELLIISPYFVPGPDMKQAFASARARGVTIRVLTNSLASNDAPVAHVGYARHREELLAMGIELYELRSEQAGLGSAFGASGASGSNVAGESRSMLHSKVLVMDGRLLVIGSMNLDLRSQHQNTEIALLIASNALSRMASDQIESTLRDGAWHVERAESGLIWRAPRGSQLKDATTEPDTSAGLRLLLKLLGPLAPDEML
jgi:phosphatidylserine/phosphatidylglycerophosphate/cardiolipin synthase-like enzyme